MTRPVVLPRPLEKVRDAIVTCERCPRLRAYCVRIGREKRKAFREEPYWARPVPGFGDPAAVMALVGLAPAAHGANRTGRNFTGDGVGGSGDFLMTALHANGLANQPFSHHAADGLRLNGAWIAAAARCAPPDNKPTPGELRNCYPHLAAELDALGSLQVLVALGRVAFDACLQYLRRRGSAWSRKPLFEHGGVYRLHPDLTLVAAYHPSRQNTQTGRLTPEMLSDVFREAVRLAAAPRGAARTA